MDKKQKRHENYLKNKQAELSKSKIYHDTHREEIVLYKKQYAVDNKESKKAYQHNYYINNKEKVLNKSKKYYAEHKQAVIARTKNYALAHPEQVKKKLQRYAEKHKDRILAKEEKRRTADPNRYKDYMRKVHLVYAYGISDDVYKSMLLSQGNTCAICNEDNNGRALEVDHDHKTGKIRGLLCRSCNTAIGFIKDNPETAESIAIYLRKGILA